jgi:isopentenyl-diphosphate Delta-isomerase
MWLAGSGKRTDGNSQSAGRSPTSVASRKADHVRINLEEDVAAKGISSGFDDYYFLHCALPELNLDDVDPSTELFGRRLSAPLLISCMIGGTERAAALNRALAQVAQHLQVSMGLGSGRILLEDPEVLKTFDVRRIAPDVLLFANLGAIQLNKGYGVDHCRRLVDALGADALVLHLNALQEAVQPEGDTCFAGLLAKIGELCRRLDVPVVVKEVGWGIAPDGVRALVDAGVAAVDIAGAGGTSWSEVESHRISEPWRAHVATAFAAWGIPTAECLRSAARVAPEARIFASGGIRNGIDIAKAVALGADLAGIAGPFLRGAAKGEEGVLALGRELVETLRIAMFCLGARTLADLRFTPRLRRRGDDEAAPHIARLTYRTDEAGQFLDITDDVSAIVRSSGVRRGLAHVYAMHTTAAVRINENERLLLRDFRRFLDRIAPTGEGVYEHDDLPRRPDVPPDEPINGHAHCQHLLLSAGETVPIVDGQLELGRWQRIFLVELCAARERRVTVQVLGR